MTDQRSEVNNVRWLKYPNGEKVNFKRISFKNQTWNVGCGCERKWWTTQFDVMVYPT